jgi:archaellum biogenesis ATPase FlaH
MNPHDQLPHEELGEGWTDCYQLASDPKSLEPPKVLKSGIGIFDESMPFGGIPIGSIGVWLGEMKAGKSRFVLALCAGWAYRSAKVAYVMGEMSPEEHFERLEVMCLGLTAEEMKDSKHRKKRMECREWLRDSVGRNLRFKAMPLTFDAITKAAEWAGDGGVVVVDSIQRMKGVQRASSRADEIEAAMDHVNMLSKAHRCAFQVLCEIGQAPKGRERGDHDWCKHSSSPRQNCDFSRIVHQRQGTTQRITCLDDRRGGQGRDFTLILDEANLMPVIPMWERKA